MKHSPGFLALVNDAKSRVKQMSIEDYRRRVAAGEAFVLVDTREDNEWASAHATGAMHLSKGVIEREIEQAVPEKDAPVVLYCGGGFRSALVADNLQKMGYTNVISLDGGWRGWVAAGLPTEKGGA
ncbi:MAG: sulfurtransferase [Candidatus Eisenbacteria bacterium]|uniref:Sulfurtransferase n=1 Tax=Eiseniibacteriota bacterium TaxID=2212470 RepID=A0A849SQ19_UNCEI|nr:sulfurtransferase [Candidatus Eisenbacteria bacterium]